jgi:hypothetical protein
MLSGTYPILLKRLPELMNSYSNYQVFGQPLTPTQMNLCDAFDDPAQISHHFFTLGFYLAKNIPILPGQLQREVPEFSEFVFTQRIL